MENNTAMAIVGIGGIDMVNALFSGINLDVILKFIIVLATAGQTIRASIKNKVNEKPKK